MNMPLRDGLGSERWQTARRFLNSFARLAFLTAVCSSPGYAYCWYSNIEVQSNGTVHGWAVTDVYAGSYIHTAYVYTTLRSPQNRTASASYSDYDIARAEADFKKNLITSEVLALMTYLTR